MAKHSKAPAEGAYGNGDRTSDTDDERIKNVTPLPPPEDLIRFFPIHDTPMEALVARTRGNIRRILNGNDDRLLVIVGPCSIHDPAAALEYARQAQGRSAKARRPLEIVMRVYFEKPRTTVGWKGLINDPHLDESYDIDQGLRVARQLLVDITAWACRRAPSFSTPSRRSTSPTWSPGARSARARPRARCIASSPRACRCRSASRTAPTATSRSRSTPSSPPPPASLPVGAQERQGRHRRDARQHRLPRDPARRQGAELRRRAASRRRARSSRRPSCRHA